MKVSFEELLSFLTSLRPSRITFNFNVSTVYADSPHLGGKGVKEIWDTLGMEEGERVECCGEMYDGSRLKGSFYPGVAVKVKGHLSWHRGTVEAFSILYDVGDVVVVEGRRRRAYRGSFRERGHLHLYGWRYAHLPGGGMFFTRVPRATRRFALTTGRFQRLSFPAGYNVLVRIYEELGDWRREVEAAVKGNGTEVRSPTEKVFRVGKYLVKVLGDDLLILHEGRATFRVLYERLLQGTPKTRKLLMPLNVGEVPEGVSSRLSEVGFRIKDGKLVEVPDFLRVVDPTSMVALTESLSGTESRETVALKVAEVLSGTSVMDPEDLIINLMLCNNPYQDPLGRIIVRRITAEEMDELLQ